MERFNVCTYINIFFLFNAISYFRSAAACYMDCVARPCAFRCVRARVVCCARCARARRPAVAPATAAANNPESGRPSRRRPARSTFHRSRPRHLRPPRRHRRTHARTHLRTHKHTHVCTHARRTVVRVCRWPTARQSIGDASTTVVGVVLVLPYYTTPFPVPRRRISPQRAARSSAHRCRCSPSLS